MITTGTRLPQGRLLWSCSVETAPVSACLQGEGAGDNLQRMVTLAVAATLGSTGKTHTQLKP